MNTLLNNKNFLKKFSTAISIATIIFALNLTGVFAGIDIYGFWRTLDNATSNGVTNPTQYEFGYGYGYGHFGYGYGYGFENGSFTDGRLTETESTTSIVKNDHAIQVTVPVNTTITLDPVSSITNLDLNEITTSAVVASTVNLGSSTAIAALDFGIAGAKLNFSQPIRIDIPVPGYSQPTIQIKVKHFGDASFNTSGLTATSSDTCTNGVAGIPSNIATVSANIATIYSCSASQFAAVNPSSGGSGGAYVPATSTGTTSTGTTTTNTGTTTTSTGMTNTNSGTMNTGSGNVTEMYSFADISQSWAKSYIEALAKLGIVSTTNVNFEPERVITRAEFLKMTLRAYNYTYASTDAESQSYNDVDMTAWYANVIGKASSLGVIASTNTNFRPNDSINRAEAMKILFSIAALTDSRFTPSEVSESSFMDVTEGWQVKYIERAKSLGIASGEVNSKGEMIFRPMDSITRAETSKIIVRSIEL